MLFQWACTKHPTTRVGLTQSGHHHYPLECSLLSLWYSWKIAHLALNTNHSLQEPNITIWTQTKQQRNSKNKINNSEPSEHTLLAQIRKYCSVPTFQYNPCKYRMLHNNKSLKYLIINDEITFNHKLYKLCFIIIVGKTYSQRGHDLWVKGKLSFKTDDLLKEVQFLWNFH